MRSGAVLPPSELLRKPGGFEPFRLVEVGASGCDLAVTDLDHVPRGPLYPHAVHPTHRDEMHLDQNSIVNRVGRAGVAETVSQVSSLNLQEVGDALMAAIDGPLHIPPPNKAGRHSTSGLTSTSTAFTSRALKASWTRRTISTFSCDIFQAAQYLSPRHCQR